MASVGDAVPVGDRNSILSADADACVGLGAGQCQAHGGEGSDVLAAEQCVRHDALPSYQFETGGAFFLALQFLSMGATREMVRAPAAGFDGPRIPAPPVPQLRRPG
jgi:hypothetical protein